ncbi:MAG: ArsR/SmtB family transcription factor [Symbiobacteriia bacterium]
MTETGYHDVFSAIADPTRRQVLGLLAGGEQSVTALTSHFTVTRPAVSKHLAILRQAGLVTERKVGRERRYRLRAEPLQEVRDWTSHFERFWSEKLMALQKHLEEES